MKKFLKATSVFFALVLLFSACGKEDAVVNPDTNSEYKNKPNLVMYYSMWTLDDGKELKMEMLVDVDRDAILGFFANGKKIDIPKDKAFKKFHYPENAFECFDDCVKKGFDCVRVDRFDNSAQNSLTRQPESYYIVFYGHSNENGGCDWVAIMSEPGSEYFQDK